MKRLTAIILAVVLVFSNALTCFADTVNSEPQETVTEAAEETAAMEETAEAETMSGETAEASEPESAAAEETETKAEETPGEETVLTVGEETVQEAAVTADEEEVRETFEEAQPASPSEVRKEEGIYRSSEQIAELVDELLRDSTYADGEAVIVVYKDADVDSIIGSVEISQEVSSEVAEALSDEMMTEGDETFVSENEKDVSETDEGEVPLRDGVLENDVNDEYLSIDLFNEDEEELPETFEFYSDDELASDAGLVLTENTFEEPAEINPDAIDDSVIAFVEKPGMSTRELLKKLLENPMVISAEPNYIYMPDEENDYEPAKVTDAVVGESTTQVSTSVANQTVSAEAAAAKAAVKAAAGTGSGALDMTELQYAYNHHGDSEKFNSMYYGTRVSDGSDVGVPGWNKYDSGSSPVANASGYVALMDTGVDIYNEDLKNVMADLKTELGNTVFAEIGGAPQGINTTSAAEAANLDDHSSHGTHVAGIMAAEWNNKGISGAESGAKLIAVKASGMTKGFSAKSIIKGADYLRKVQKALKTKYASVPLKDKKLIRTLNCSFGGSGNYSTAESLAFYNLGKEGVVIFFSSGNDGKNVDINPRSSSQFRSNPYVIVVDNLDVGGKKTGSSNYGFMTDLFAPGDDIISTVPNEYLKPYLPEADPERLAFHTFDYSPSEYGKSGLVALDDDDKLIGSVDPDHSFDNAESGGANGCLRINFSEMTRFINNSGQEVGRVAYLKVPYTTSSKEKPNFIALRSTRGFSNRQYRGSVQIGMRKRDGSKDGTIFWSQGYELVDTVSIDTSNLGIKGDLAGYEVYGNGGFYIKLSFKKVGEGSGNPFVFIDTVGAGMNTEPYAYKSGTSMATPCAAGSAAVVYEQMIAGRDETDADLSALALDVVETVKESVVVPNAANQSYADDNYKLWKLCRSGGMLNLGAKYEAAAKPKHVTLSSGEFNTANNELTLYGRNLFANVKDVYVSLSPYTDEKSSYVVLGDGDTTTAETYVKTTLTAAQRKLIHPGVNYFVVEDSGGKFTVADINLNYTDELKLYETQYDLPFLSGWEENEFTTSGGREKMWTSTAYERAMAECGDEVYILSREGIDGPALNIFCKTDTANAKAVQIGAYPGSADGRYLSYGSMASIGNVLYAYGYVRQDSDGKGLGYRLYYYDTTVTGEQWHEVKLTGSKEFVPQAGATLASLGDKLYLVGRCKFTKVNGKVRETYPTDDIAQITLSSKGVVSAYNQSYASICLSTKDGGRTGIIYPRVATDTAKGRIYVVGGYYKSYSGEKGDYSTILGVSIASFGGDASVTYHDRMDNYFSNVGDMIYDIAAYNDKVYFVGGNSKKDTEFGEDTFVWDRNAKTMTGLHRRAAPGYKPAVVAALAVHGGKPRLYACGDSGYEKPLDSAADPAVITTFLRSTELEAPLAAASAKPAFAAMKMSAAAPALTVGNGSSDYADGKVSVTFVLNGGLYDSEPGDITLYYDKGVTFGALPKLSAPDNYKSKVSFAGWFEGTIDGYDGKDDSFNEDDPQFSWDTEVNADTVINEDMTVYAKWSEEFEVYTVKHYEEKCGAYAFYFDEHDYFDKDVDYREDDDEFDDFIGSEEGDDGDIEYFEQVLMDYDLVKTEYLGGKLGETTNAAPYVKKGFYTLFEDGEDQVSIEEGGITEVSIFYLREEYLVFYDKNDGSGATEYDFLEFEDKVAPLKNVFSREGYEPDGWYLDEACTKPFSDSTLVDSDLYLYAKWKKEGSRRTGGSGGSGGTTAFVPSFVIQQGSWILQDGKWRFNDARGWKAIAESTWKKNAKPGAYAWFVFDNSGFMITGWFTDHDGRKYYLNPEQGENLGVMMTGWVKIGDMWYYFCEGPGTGREFGELITSQKEEPKRF